MIRRPLVIPGSMLRMPSPNRDEISGIVSLTQAEARLLPPSLRFVFLCFTNRCGSSYLGEILSSTGIFNPVEEPFNFDEVQPICTAYGIKSVGEYFCFIAQRSARNGIYILKAAIDHLRLLVEANVLDQIIDRTDFIFLQRRDKLDQAISRAIVEQNRQWAWHMAPTIPNEELTYSSEQISAGIDYVLACNQAFDHFFSLNGITSINLEYERLVSEPQQELDRIARRLQIPKLTLAADKVGIRRQAGSVNQSWRERFLHEALPSDPVANEPSEIFVEPVPDVHLDILAHIQNRGDVTAGSGRWIGAPGGDAWIEGFSITPRQSLAPDDIAYQGVYGDQSPAPWVRGGGFCGSRGVRLPLRGLSIELRNAARQRFQCSYTASFMDGSTVGPTPGGQICHSAAWAPLVRFRVEMWPRGSLPPAPLSSGSVSAGQSSP
jgi:LPS sulfotransferase NodH